MPMMPASAVSTAKLHPPRLNIERRVTFLFLFLQAQVPRERPYQDAFPPRARDREVWTGEDSWGSAEASRPLRRRPLDWGLSEVWERRGEVGVGDSEE
jgi:hypothetical protein